MPVKNKYSCLPWLLGHLRKYPGRQLIRRVCKTAGGGLIWDGTDKRARIAFTFARALTGVTIRFISETLR